jgi:HD-GYP domain-containing protein (c-di-GMP phosphodiesterase class II)
MFNFFKSNKTDEASKASSQGPAPNVSLSTTRVAVVDLKRGMHVSALDRPWSETSFPFRGFTVQTVEDIAALQEQCEYVVIDSLTYKAFSEAKQKRNRYLIESNSNSNSPDTVQFTKDFTGAGQVHAQAKSAIKSMFTELKLVNEINAGAVQNVVDGCVTSILKNPDAMLWYTQIQNKNRHIAQHSLNVCILAIALGKHLGLREGELDDLGTCGLLHDVGKTSLPAELLEKKDNLTDREKQVLKEHTIAGRNVLLSSKTVFSGAADVAFSHHERIDGSGYPRGVVGAKVSNYAKIIAIADSYDNLINDEIFNQLRSPNEALKYIFDAKGSKFDNYLALNFIECVGVYPPGTLVEMSSGEVGIVLSNSSSDTVRTRVILILDKCKQPCPQRVVELTQFAGEQEPESYCIKTALRKGSYGVDVGNYIRAGLRIDKSPLIKLVI